MILAAPIEKLCVHLPWLGQSIVEDADITTTTTRPTPHVCNLPQKRNRQQEEEARQQIVNKLLHPEAADLLGRIRLVEEQRVQDDENQLIMLAQSGQLRSKVTELQLKEVFAAVADDKEKGDYPQQTQGPGQ
ncbi:programmed cell death protein 5 [Colletotrichum tofieldiae]|nr:programmed cell death protein 5 [Colletotrichum tofieldiae]